MSNLIILIEKKYRIVVFLFFILFLFVGVSIFQDYGIGCDDPFLRYLGGATFRYILGQDQYLRLPVKDMYHGSIFEIFLFALEKMFNISDQLRIVYLMRHLVTFLMFYISVYFFYLLVKRRFQDWKIGLLGSTFLIISPRIFAHSFYNSKDLVVLSLFIISMYTMIRYLKNTSLWNAFFHALTSALLIDVRVVGIIIPFITIVFLGFDLALAVTKQEQEKKSAIISLALLFFLFLLAIRFIFRLLASPLCSFVWYAMIRYPRISNIVFFAIVVSVPILMIRKIQEREVKRIIGSLLAYIILLIVFIVCFWPVLWKNPLYHFIAAIMQMSSFPWEGSVLYFGKYILAISIPWHYIPVWILITTPMLYSLCFVIGCFFVFKSALRNPQQFFIDKREDCIYMLCFFIPILTVIALRSVLYDEWRQMFFIYPAMLLIALIGVTSSFAYAKEKLRVSSYKIIKIILIFVIFGCLFYTVSFMIQNHPHQNVYFNKLAGRNMGEVKKNFELDYWGLSYKQALEYILRNDSDSDIRINVDHFYGKFNAMILNADERKRLVFVEDPKEAKYFIGGYRWHKEEYPYTNEFYSVRVKGERILVVYKMK